MAEIAAKEADMLLLLIDGRASLTSSDYILANEVQKSSKPFVLVVNNFNSN